MNRARTDLVLVLTPLLFNLALIGALAVVIRQSDLDMERYIRAKSMISTCNTLSKLFYDAGVAMGGYSITRSPLFGDRYNKIVKEIPRDVDDLRELIGEDARQKKILQEIDSTVSAGIKILDESKVLIDKDEPPGKNKQTDNDAKDSAKHSESSSKESKNSDAQSNTAARKMYKTIRMLADRLQDQLRDLGQEERKIESKGFESANRSKIQIKMWLVLGVIINIFLAVALAWYAGRSRRQTLKMD